MVLIPGFQKAFDFNAIHQNMPYTIFKSEIMDLKKNHCKYRANQMFLYIFIILKTSASISILFYAFKLQLDPFCTKK